MDRLLAAADRLEREAIASFEEHDQGRQDTSAVCEALRDALAILDEWEWDIQSSDDPDNAEWRAAFRRLQEARRG